MIHVLGDIIIDEYWHGDSNRLSPEAPVPIVNLKEKQICLGGAANVYNNIKALTNDVNLYGLVQDEYLDYFDDKDNLIKTDKMPIKIRVMSGNHYVTRIDDEVYMDNNKLVDYFISSFRNFKPDDILYLSDYAKGTIASPSGFISYCGIHKIKTVVDPKVNLSEYHGCWLLKPNRKEFESYTGSTSSIKDITTNAKDFRLQHGIEHMVITLSEDGVLYVGPDDTFHLPTLVNEVSDVTGAGDTFGAIMTYYLSKNYPIEKALEKANMAAAKAVQHTGTYVYEI